MRERRREHRRSKRVRKRQAALIGHGDGRADTPCVVWDLSDGGARLSAARIDALPRAFVLFLGKDRTARRYCRVVWRKGAQVGVQFVQEYELDLDAALHPAKAAATAPAPLSAQEMEAARSQLTYQLRRPAVIASAERRGFTFSSLSAGLVILLGVATAVFFAAGMQASAGAPWALHVCTSAKSFCEHPEFGAAAGMMMSVVYLAVKGMEL
jgi:hypothetical protein